MLTEIIIGLLAALVLILSVMLACVLHWMSKIKVFR